MEPRVTEDNLRVQGCAVVTGGARGIGRAVCESLASAGCNVAVNHSSAGSAQIAADFAWSLEERFGVSARAFEADVSSFEAAASLLEDAACALGPVRVLVNNAGGGSGNGECNFLKRDPAAIKNMIDVNLTGALYCCRAVCGYMAEAHHGCVINMASIAALVGRDRAMYHDSNKMEQPVEYAAAKGGIISMTQDLAAYMAPYGVRVNCISPGGFDKGDLPEAFTKAYGAATPLGRMGKMGEEIKGAALFPRVDVKKELEALSGGTEEAPEKEEKKPEKKAEAPKAEEAKAEIATFDEDHVYDQTDSQGF
ncbi:SDR family NAD(P)-dependent oxidoreductase, partial [uncultured Slackia sp.]|uniref:SDR family NAD(P)-dependent oxidoreductase n=1 Tax=uncultured Slackia sp. TaxID=665903 RepID=UPI0026259025